MDGCFRTVVVRVLLNRKKKIKQEEKMEREYTTDEKVYRYLSIREKYLNWGKFVSI